MVYFQTVWYVIAVIFQTPPFGHFLCFLPILQKMSFIYAIHFVQYSLRAIYCTFKEKRCQNFGAWTAFCMLHKNNVNQSSNHLWNVKMASAALRVTRALCADLITTRPALNIPLNIRLTSVKFLILQDIQPDISWINHQF